MNKKGMRLTEKELKNALVGGTILGGGGGGSAVKGEKYAKLAKQKKILALGGSNFHGMYNKEKLSIGTYATPDKQLDELMSYKAKQKRLRKKAEQEALSDK